MRRAQRGLSSANITVVHPPQLDFALAKDSDAQAIFDLVYLHPDPFLRTATLKDVEGWIRNGACWIVRDFTGNKIVGACNIKVPETTAAKPPEPAEFGGIFIHPDYRDRGVADALGVLALASYYWDNDPDSAVPIPVISHVHVENEKPLKLLDRLGFEFHGIISVPDGIPGFEHMPRNENGELRGKEFQFPPNRRIHLFREMAKLLSTDQIGNYAAHILPALGMDASELERLAEILETTLDQT
jgi:RimJ/RimL family protein N-acetyltransferase